MTDTTYRLLTPDGDAVSEVVSDSLHGAAQRAEDIGYEVEDTEEPDVVVVSPLLPDAPPVFSTEVTVQYVPVVIEPGALEAAGWVYVGNAATVTPEHVLRAVHRWHEMEHTDPWLLCTHPLCEEVKR